MWPFSKTSSNEDEEEECDHEWEEYAHWHRTDIGVSDEGAVGVVRVTPIKRKCNRCPKVEEVGEEYDEYILITEDALEERLEAFHDMVRNEYW